MYIVPHPHKTVKLGGEFTLDNQTKVFSEDAFLDEAQRFVSIVENCCGFKLQFAQDISCAQVIFTYTDKCKDEEYFLMISEGLATLSAADKRGCFYGVETLRQLLNLDAEQSEHKCDNCYIQDAPKYEYRGLSVDICRHFFPLDTLKQIVELMSRVKLNKLHLHLSDDQGFRIQIDKYPLLNSVGSTRTGSEVLENGVRSVDEKEVSGYLTKADAKELVEFAAKHNVEIVPELDVPGHAIAMLAAYPQFCCEGEKQEVRKKWGVSKDILCAGNDETYVFVKDILEEICQLFPSKYIHLGGDEAPKDRWCNCKKCREKLSELKLDNFEQLQTYMIEQFRAFLETKGKTVICWNDGVQKGASDKIVSQVWKPLTISAGVQQANKGRKIIMSPFFSMYFDYPYAMTTLRKTYKFNAAKGVKKRNLQNVLGVEGAIWTEYIATEEKLFFNLLPRMLALAECAWGSKTKDFAKRVNEYVKLYDKLGLTYNETATQSRCRNLHRIKQFFKYNPNIELDKQNKSKQQTEK